MTDVWGRARAEGNFALATPAIRSPRIRWRAQLTGRKQLRPQLLASPLGILAIFGESYATRAERPAVVFHPLTGAILHSWDVAVGAAPCDLSRDRIFEPRDDVFIERTLEDGRVRELVHTTKELQTRFFDVRSELGIIQMRRGRVWRALELGGEGTAAVTIDDALVIDGKKDLPTPEALVATRSLIYRQERTASGWRVRALERRSGRDLWAFNGRFGLADDEGALLIPEGALCLLDDRAGVRWSRPHATPLALSATIALVAEEGQGAVSDVVFLERGTGCELGRRRELALDSRRALVADALYAVVARERVDEEEGTGGDDVVALSVSGAVLWTLPLVGESVLALAPLDGRLHVLTSLGSLLCIEESP